MYERKLQSVEKDAEELVNILYSDQNSSAVAQEIEGIDKLQFVLQLPSDDLESKKLSSEAIKVLV